MKQHKTLNINLKLKLSKTPTLKEKKELLNNLNKYIYNTGLFDFKLTKDIFLKDYKCSIRKMGK